MAIELYDEDEALPPSSGFQAYLENANLHNLLQIECLSRTTGVFRIIGDNTIGYMHLENGHLIHAQTDSQQGEAAALEILAWGAGQFGSCEEPLSATRTVNVPLEGLLLTMAKQVDETEYAQGTRARDTQPSIRMTRSATRPGTVTSRRPIAGRPPAASEGCIADVVVSKSGEVLQQRGMQLDDFPPRVAYAARLADLIGQAIGSGKPSALTLRGQHTATVVCRLKDGNLVASLTQPSATRRVGV